MGFLAEDGNADEQMNDPIIKDNKSKTSPEKESATKEIAANS